jgi:flagellar hook-associated protein 3 FlgL
MQPLGTASFYARASASIGAVRARAEDLQARIATGERLTRSSDDPLAASRLRRLAQAETLATVNDDNAARASSDLALADDALAGFADGLTRARELALQAASGTLNDSQRAAIGTELGQIHADLLDLANARDSAGHALFGGETSGDAYALDASGNATYLGTASSNALELGDGVSVSRGLTGPEFLGPGGGMLDLVGALASALQTGSPDPRTAAQGALTSLDNATRAIGTAQAVVGGRLAAVELATDRAIRTGELRAAEQARLGDTDLAGTIAELQQTMLVLEASQASFARLSSLSLFDAL